MATKKTYKDLEKEINKLEREKALYLIDIEKYQSLLNIAPLGVFQATIEGKYTEINNAFARLLGYRSTDDAINSVSDISRQIYADPSERKTLVKKIVQGNNIVNHEAVTIY